MHSKSTAQAVAVVCGASTIFIAELLPETEVIGVELDSQRVELARMVLAARGLKNIGFEQSPGPESLPEDIGLFDFVMLSAVYEHCCQTNAGRSCL
jgi:predicted O-methyltransferase YrrM